MRWSVLLLCILFLSACSTVQMGSRGAGSPATGAAAGSTAVNKNVRLEHCSEPLGTLAIHEDPDAPWLSVFSRYHLGSTVPVLRLIVQQSNCFVIVERGRGFHDIMRERELMRNRELRRGSHFGKGQLVAADYTMIPSVTFSEKNTGGVTGVIGGLISGIAGGVLGSVKFSDASTTLVLVDNRSGVQVAAAQGSARGYDIGGLGGVFGGGTLAGLGAYGNTPEGKIIVAAFMDAYNNLVKAVRVYKMQKVKGGLGKGGKLKIQK
jgi:hypothetical protein